VREVLTDLGYDVSVNDPYAGAWILQRCSAPEQGIHSLQIEIRRDLYMDETTLECHEGFARLQKDLSRLIVQMKEFADEQLNRKPEDGVRVSCSIPECTPPHQHRSPASLT